MKYFNNLILGISIHLSSWTALFLMFFGFLPKFWNFLCDKKDICSLA